ncbi:MAG: O-antigen ligase family protein [Hyphomicrobiaceae bacterium]
MLASIVVAAAMASSSIVFSEPAVADALMAAAIVGLPVLGVLRLGRITLLNAALWFVVVGAGIAATSLSATFDTAIKHQLVTLFLLLGALVISGYIAADPEPRFHLVMVFYVAAALVATLAALAGYFQLLPGAYDLFTSYGRGRGTFKDPNVYGAALIPALAYLCWIMLREKAERVVPAAFAVAVLSIGLLVSFSRGAWIAAAFAVAVVVWTAVVRFRRRSDRQRLLIVATLGGLAFTAIVAGALQFDAVKSLFAERASLSQSYDVGPEGRFGGQQKAIALILDHPLGIGTHTFRDVHHPEEPHNVYLSTFLNAGWIGGLLYIASVLVTLGVGLRMSLRMGALQGPAVVATASLAALAFEGVVIDSDHWRHFFIVMGCVWGLADAVPPMIDSGRRRSDPQRAA